MEFARTGDFAYVSSLDTISVLDLTDPRTPHVRGTLVNALFENEAMTYGERRNVDGSVTRFVLAGIDLLQASPGDPDHVNATTARRSRHRRRHRPRPAPHPQPRQDDDEHPHRAVREPGRLPPRLHGGQPG